MPVINKIDLPSAQPEVVIEELENVLAIPREEVILVSAKEGTNIDLVLEAIVERVPAPKGDPDAPLRGLIFDSHYDAYKGVVAYVRLAEGTLHARENIQLMQSGVQLDVIELGMFRPQLAPVDVLGPGEVGYVATGLKSVRDCQVGDTMTTSARPATEALPGYKQARSLVFAGIYPLNGPDYPLLRDALEKLHLNDASITYPAGELRRARLRLPLRLPGPAPHGDHPGAPGTRVRPRPHRLRAVGGVPRDDDARHGRGRRG